MPETVAAATARALAEAGIDRVFGLPGGEVSDVARRAVAGQRSLVVAVPVDYRDYRRLF